MFGKEEIWPKVGFKEEVMKLSAIHLFHSQSSTVQITFLNEFSKQIMFAIVNIHILIHTKHLIGQNNMS